MREGTHTPVKAGKINNTGIFYTSKESDKPERYKSREVAGMDVIDLVKHWNLDFNEGLTNLVSRGLDKVRSSIKNAEKRTGLSVDASKNNKNNPVSGDNIRKRLESQKKRKN